MAISKFISSDRQAADAKRAIAEIERALSSEQILASIVQGLPSVAVSGVNKALKTERDELKQALDAYEKGKIGEIDALKARAGNDPGMALIVARISRGLSQKELGRKLGLKEQQIQRYEIERYRSLSLANYQKFASVLGVQLVPMHAEPQNGWSLAKDISPDEARKVLKHARDNGWLNKNIESEEGSLAELKKNVADHIVKYGSPSMLRTGLNVVDLKEDWSLLFWKAQITRKAEEEIKNEKLSYQPMQVSWLCDLVKLSRKKDGPRLAVDMLREHGIVLILERQIPGLKLDGAAFLINEVPVIGLSLLRDTIDNFWFTLLHEVAHVVLHYRTGLSVGFFDDMENSKLDELEQEANEFAGNLLIPEEKWRRSPARISKSASAITKFADQLEIHPAIVFGRIRKERNNYAIFSDRTGRGEVRKLFFGQEANHTHA
ncbi:MAG: XRE family transcriptional regulator [Paracoccaceae bacterium]|uniref:XRE family transcriptional regulator n=1 Tax=Alphaproteobacteria TaxID=28211 RepID=UPI0032654904